MDEPRAKRVFDGVNVVAVGLILLANTTGVLPWSAWWSVLSLWPLLLVAGGLDIIGRSLRNAPLRVLSSLLVLGGLAYGALVMPSAGVPAPWRTSGTAEPFALSEAGDADAGRGTAVVKAGLGRLTLRAGDRLATADGRSPFGAPSLEVSRNGSSVDVRIESTGRGQGPLVFRDGGPFMDVTLDRDVIWDSIEIQSAMSDSDIDLTDLSVARTKLDLGMSSGKVTYGRRVTDAESTIDGGMASLTVRVPEDLGVEVEARTGLGDIDVPSGWDRTSGSGGWSRWRSRGYSESSAKLKLTIEAGMSSVEIQQY